jgi:hypothetical protein
MLKRMKNYFLLVSVFLLASSLMLAQTQSGTLKVKVIDNEGNIVPGATLTLTSPVMMGTASQVTNTLGEALFINLTPGKYELTTRLEGFQAKITQAIEISIDRRTVLQVEMHLEPIQEEITVTAEAPLVDTSRSVIADHVTHETVESLPIARDFVSYLQLAAGVNIVPNSQGRDMPQDPAGKGGQNYYDRGLQGSDPPVSETGGGKRGSRDNLYFLDGMNITGLSSQNALMNFNNEVIQEQELMTSGVPAEYGGGKGIVGNIVTKSGGNRLSGSANLYMQPEGFWLPYGGSAYENADKPETPFSEATMLEGFKDDAYDTAATLGGPIMKDKLWFFLSGQYRNNAKTYILSESASSIGEQADYSQKRSGFFGKASFKPTVNDSLTFMYFLDAYDIIGERDSNILKTRQRSREYDYNVFSGYYQRVLGENLIFDLRYGRYQRKYVLTPRYPEAGINDTMYFRAGTYPAIEDFSFGSFDQPGDYDNIRSQFSGSLEWYASNHRAKMGFMYSRETDLDAPYYTNGERRNSVDPSLAGATLGQLLDWGIWPSSEFSERLLPALNNNWGPTSEAYDLNNDGVVSSDELRTATFTDMNERGLYFKREMDEQVGENNVLASRYMGYLMDDWKVNDYFTINAGVRIEKHDYFASDDSVIMKMPVRFMPRIGLVWNIGGRGTHKLTAFYGQFSDPVAFSMVHFAGNITGAVRNEQIWLNHDWFTFRVRGSAERRDAVWTPNTRDALSHEASLTHEIDVGNGVVFATQAYYRQDRRIIEDYDLFTYVEHYEGDPNWGHLDLSFEDFGYPASGPPGTANYFLSNLIGAKREMYGLDFEVSKRFQNGSFLVAQYSYKNAKGNSQSDGNADLQGDFIQLDPRNEWMWGRTPGSIPHKIKLFGTYRTPFGLDIGALFYWNSGMVYTESYDFIPGRYSIYYNWPLNDEETQMAKTGEEQTPSYYQIDLKLNYTLRFLKTASVQFFCDIYNVTNSQHALDLQYARNDPQWDYQDVVELLMPMRLYVGARIRF